MSNSSTEPTVAWYKQMWPWILISIPGSSVIAGFVMLWLALNTQHSMVVDDYFKYGKTINKRIERDVKAAGLGLHAKLTPLADEIRLSMTSTVAAMPAWPESLRLRVVHPSDAKQDRRIELHRKPSGIYHGPSFAPGRWQIHVEPPSKQWRLVSKMGVVTLGEPVQIAFRDNLLPKQ